MVKFFFSIALKDRCET